MESGGRERASLRKVSIAKIFRQLSSGSIFVEDIARGAYRLEHLTTDDLIRVAELEATYSDLDLGMVDASVITVCEKLGEKKVATLDQRHFRAVRPRHCDYLQLLPA